MTIGEMVAGPDRRGPRAPTSAPFSGLDVRPRAMLYAPARPAFIGEESSCSVDVVRRLLGTSDLSSLACRPLKLCFAPALLVWVLLLASR